jgi:CDP-paratose 2-epimerase
MRILVTGGAGFVGSNLALMLKRNVPDAELCAFDNLRRRGSELAVPRLRAAGVEFVHGDVRCPADLAAAGRFDVLIECSAEPSVHAGYQGSPAYLIDTNLIGTAHCLDAARAHHADVIFLSTSRVYPIELLRALPLARHADRFELPPSGSGCGWSFEGITTEFPLSGHRSLYGATKLASELLVEEYRAMYGLRTIVNRCGVIAGPWQMGKIDQGFVVLWAAAHRFNTPLAYLGFGGDGLQVRDVLHVADLCDLIRIQLEDLSRFSGTTLNVGGGRRGSVSLAELTRLCRERSGTMVEIARDPETKPPDIPFYVTDNAAATSLTGWRPLRGIEQVVDDIFSWLDANRETLEPLLGGVPAAGRAHLTARN